MKSLAATALLATVFALTGAGVSAQTSVGVSIGINQPGVYGRINIGNYPQPVLMSPQPVVVVPAPVAVVRQPIYLYVPPGHQQQWSRYCGRYNACGQPVYFVQEQWVRERYQHEHPGWRGERHARWERAERHDAPGREGREGREGRGERGERGERHESGGGHDQRR